MNPIRSIQEHDGALLRLTIDRPTGNVFTGELMRELTEHIRTAADSRVLRLVVLEAEGKHFSFGAAVDEHTPERVSEMLPILRRLVMAIASSPVPVAALVQGMCLGGAFEVVLGCHFLLAASDAKFGVPEIRLGVFPPVAAVLLPRRATQALSERMILGGEEVGPEVLSQAGLVHAICPAGELHGHANAWFEKTLLRFSAASLREAVRASRSKLLEGLEHHLARTEQDYLTRLAVVSDASEGIAAFMERRKPHWSHA